jgi:hypothetical protein
MDSRLGIRHHHHLDNGGKSGPTAGEESASYPGPHTAKFSRQPVGFLPLFRWTFQPMVHENEKRNPAGEGCLNCIKALLTGDSTKR